MKILHKNLIANIVGQVWVALMGIIFIPLYIKYLGIEVYGLLGFFASLQLCMMLLDMGLAPGLSREMARFIGGEHSKSSIHNLLRSVEVAITLLSLFIFSMCLATSSIIAEKWLNTEIIPLESVVTSIYIMGGVVALRLVEAIYRGCLIGLQKQVVFNMASSLLATFRWMGAAVVLIYISSTIITFFIWQGISSIVSIIVLRKITYKSLPNINSKTKPSLKKLKSITGFAGGLAAISVLTIVLTQVDKLLLAGLLPLTEYGYYTLAATIAGGLYTIAGPISQAYYPKFCELNSKKHTIELHHAYHTGAQLSSVLVGGAGMVVIIFVEDFLKLWTNNILITEKTSTLLSVLMLGNLINCLLWIPYQAQLAYGWTQLALKVNVISIFFVLPSIWLIAPNFGALGVAWVWVTLNIGYFLITIQFMHRRILNNEKWTWYLKDTLFPIIPTALTLLLLEEIFPMGNSNWSNFARLALASILALVVGSLFAVQVRTFIFSQIKKQFELSIKV